MLTASLRLAICLLPALMIALVLELLVQQQVPLLWG